MQKLKYFFEKRPELVIVPVFLVFYIFSLTFHYVEGDDAYSIIYHALGRNNAIQVPYSAYQGMMDVVMSVFPADETLLRTIAISIHAVFGILFPLSIVLLIRNMLCKEYPYLWMFALLIPFLVPEFVFSGLYYQCSSIAITLMLISHVWFRKVFQNGFSVFDSRLWGAIILFVIGTGFRWDCGFYLVFILLDLMFMQGAYSLRERWFKIASVGLVCGITVLSFLYLQGVNFGKIINTYQFSQKIIGEGREFSWMINIGSSMSLFTPAFLLLFIVGLITDLANKRFLLLTGFIIMYIPVLKIVPSEALNPRRIITLIPIFCIWGYMGFDILMSLKKQGLAATVIGILVLLPWVLGFQVDTDSTMWGPGFDIKTEHPHRLYGKDIEKIDNRIQLNDIRPKILRGGFAVPFEGPRPVWGYADVFYGGKWRKLLNKLNDERDNLLTAARRDKIPVFQQDWGVNLMVNLVRKGYTTHESRKSVEIDNTFYERRFFSGMDTLMFVYPHNGEHLAVYDSIFLKKIGDHYGVNKVYLYFYSSSILTEFINRFPSQTATFGPTTGIYYFNKNTE